MFKRDVTMDDSYYRVLSRNVEDFIRAEISKERPDLKYNDIIIQVKTEEEKLSVEIDIIGEKEEKITMEQFKNGESPRDSVIARVSRKLVDNYPKIMNDSEQEVKV